MTNSGSTAVVKLTVIVKKKNGSHINRPLRKKLIGPGACNKRPTAKNYHLLFFFLWLVNSLKKLANNKLVDHVEKCDLFSDFQYGFRSFRSTTDILAVVPDRITRELGILIGANRAAAL